MPRRRRCRWNWPYLGALLAILVTLALFVAWRSRAGYLARGGGASQWPLALLGSGIETVVWAWFVAAGAAIGSFLNVVAYRLPRGLAITGHSRCPFCATSIAFTDNVPVLGWLRLRGRCRVCHLPISVQYPLVELLVAVTFGLVCLNEFFSGGGNLPNPPNLMGKDLIERLTRSTLGVQLLVYLWTLAGLMAAALMALPRRPPPLKFFAWVMLPSLVFAPACPAIVQVPWREHLFESQLDQRMDAMLTVLCGTVAGVVLARLVAPMLYGRFDNKLLRHDLATGQARQLIGSLAAAGALLGWQAILAVGWLAALLAALIYPLARSGRAALNTADWAAWVWLAVFVYRVAWADWQALIARWSAWSPTGFYTLAALALLGWSAAWKQLTRSATEVGEPAECFRPD